MIGNLITLVILVGIVVLFAWLTWRAWNSKRALLKWVGIVGAGLLTLLFALVLVLALVGLYKLNAPRNNPVGNIQVAATPEQLARGERLANTCVSCHTANGQLPLSGSDFASKFGLPQIGTLYAPNLTPAGNIKDWTDGEVMRAIREGVHKNGRSLLIMPADIYRNLSDEDAQALVAYLRSQPGIGAPTPDTELNIVGVLFASLFNFQTAQPPVSNVAAAQPGTRAYGKYMVDILGCRSCHGDQLQGKVDNGAPGPPPGPNLTKIVPQWTEEQFITFFNTGTLPDGSSVPTLTLPSGFTEPRMPWPMVRAAATDADLKAMYDYLHSLPPMDNAK